MLPLSERKCFTVEEVAEIFDVSESRVYALCRSGLLPHIKLGRQLRFDQEALDEFIKAGGKALPGGWKWEK